MKTIVYVATSLDGYISGTHGELNWLIEYPNPEQSDFGFADLMNRVDAILMGRKTFEFVCKMDLWPYTKPVYVLSNTLTETPQHLSEKAFLIRPNSEHVAQSLLDSLQAQGISTLYIDGGQLVHTFIKENRVDEWVITRVPMILGSGIPLFPHLRQPIHLKHIKTETFSNGLTKSTYQKEV